jgi:hypothetical protein
MTKRAKTKRRMQRKSKDQWRIPDALWEKIEPLLPPGKPHPLGCHNPAVDPRRAMNAIFFVPRTGCQWNALNATGICSSSSAHRWFQVWTQAGVFQELWRTYHRGDSHLFSLPLFGPLVVSIARVLLRLPKSPASNHSAALQSRMLIKKTISLWHRTRERQGKRSGM